MRILLGIVTMCGVGWAKDVRIVFWNGEELFTKAEVQANQCRNHTPETRRLAIRELAPVQLTFQLLPEQSFGVGVDELDVEDGFAFEAENVLDATFEDGCQFFFSGFEFFGSRVFRECVRDHTAFGDVERELVVRAVVVVANREDAVPAEGFEGVAEFDEDVGVWRCTRERDRQSMLFCQQWHRLPGVDLAKWLVLTIRPCRRSHGELLPSKLGQVILTAVGFAAA